MPPYAPTAFKNGEKPTMSKNHSKSRDNPSSTKPRGKKGKVFPENDALLQLAASIGSGKEEVAKGKVAKQAKFKNAVQSDIEKNIKRRGTATSRLKEIKDKLKRISKAHSTSSSTPRPSSLTVTKDHQAPPKKRVSFA